MLEELWSVLRAVLSFLAEGAAIMLGFVVALASTAAELLESMGEATGHEEALFLPAGRGASILILGGIAVAAISLSIALYLTRTTREGSGPSTGTDGSGSGAGGTGVPWARFSRAQVDSRPDPPWLEGVRKVVAETGLGDVVLLSERSGRQAVAIPACTKAGARQGVSTCDHASKVIQIGVRSVDPQGRVVAVSCTAQGGQACVFEVRAGGAPP